MAWKNNHLFIFICLLNKSAKFLTLTIVLFDNVIYIVCYHTKAIPRVGDNIVEIINGIMLSVHLAFLYLQDKGSRWDDGVDELYIFLIVLTVFANTVLISGRTQLFFNSIIFIVWAIFSYKNKDIQKIVQDRELVGYI